MYLAWHGFSCLRIIAKGPEGECTLVVDPFQKEGKYKVPQAQAQAVVVTQRDSTLHNAVREVGRSPLVFDIPGEYEVRQVLVRLIPAEKGAPEKNMASVTAEGVHIGIITAKQGECSEEQLEQLGQIDVLCLAVGDRQLLSQETAEKIVSQLEPRIVVPIHYRLPGMKKNLDSPDAFIKALGIAPEKAAKDKMRITKKDLPAEEMKVYLLAA